MQALAIPSLQEIAAPTKKGAAKTGTSSTSSTATDQLFKVLTNQITSIRAHRSDAEEQHSIVTRAGSAVFDVTLGASSAFIFPIIAHKFPKVAKIGRKGIHVPTQLIFGIGAVLIGGIGYALGIEGGRAVLSIGQGLTYGLAGNTGEKFGKAWFGGVGPSETQDRDQGLRAVS